MATRFITVRLSEKHANKIFHEWNDEHPHKPDGKHGEALVVAGRVVRVARTKAVMDAISQEILEECAGEDPDAPLPDLSRLQSAEAARQVKEAEAVAALHAQSVASAQADAGSTPTVSEGAAEDSSSEDSTPEDSPSEGVAEKAPAKKSTTTK